MNPRCKLKCLWDTIFVYRSEDFTLGGNSVEQPPAFLPRASLAK
jgi:hypothetical protein